MEISAVVTAALGILSSATKMLARKKSKEPRCGDVQEQVTRDIDISGNRNQIVHVGGDATFGVPQSLLDDDSLIPLPKGAACPHLKPKFIGNGKYEAVPNWKYLGGYSTTEGDLHWFKCLFECGETFSGLKSHFDERRDEGINAYCVCSDPSQPSDLLMRFWQERGLLH